MSTIPAPPAGCTLRATRSPNATITDGLHRLPSEILLAALEFLPQADLRNAASVSRRLRVAAQNAGLYLHHSISWQLDGRIESHLAELRAIVAHGSVYGCRLGIDFAYDGYVPSSTSIGQAYEQRMREIAKRAVSVISSALPYLVFLRLTLPNCVYTELDAGLRDPAPHLHTFELLDCGLQGMLSERRLAQLPQGLFTGHAPRLRNVALSYVSLPPAPMPVFASVKRLHLQYEDIFPSVHIARHFPRLRDLTIDYFCESLSPPLDFDLRGLTLHRLAIETNDDEQLVPYVCSMLDLTTIPELERQGDFGQNSITLDTRGAEDDDIGCAWPARLSTADRADLCARISEREKDDADIVIVVAPRCTAASGLRRTFRLLGWDLGGPNPLIDRASGLTYLRLDNVYLPGLLRRGLELPSLRELRIDLLVFGREHGEMLWPPPWGFRLGDISDSDDDLDASDNDEEIYVSDGIAEEKPCYVSCPALDVLTIYAVDTPMHVRSSEAARLSRALGHHARARLVLFGVTFREISAVSQRRRDLVVKQVFRAVDFMPFVGGFSLNDRDDGIWSY